MHAQLSLVIICSSKLTCAALELRSRATNCPQTLFLFSSGSEQTRSEAWKQLTVERKVETRGLEENSPRHNFSKACTHTCEASRIRGLWFERRRLVGRNSLTDNFWTGLKYTSGEIGPGRDVGGNI